MDIVVLLKQVPDTAALIQIDEDNVSIKAEDVKWVINPYDELAVEEAIRIKERQGRGKVTILTAGVESAAANIRTALAMGADEGVLICDPVLEKIDPYLTAKIIAAALKNLHFDLIIAGPRAVDDDGFYVPSAVAEYLGVPLLSMVVRQEIKDGKIRCEQTVQDGTIVVETDLPAMMTTQRGLNEPRYPSLSNIMKARKKEVQVKTLADIGLSPEEFGPNSLKTRIVSLVYPPKRNAGKLNIEGDTVEEKAAQLVKLLRDKTGIL
ncbi:MAG: electron transfer flavoprotein subunit beta/FixA family protein [Bacillota bacterium]